MTLIRALHLTGVIGCKLEKWFIPMLASIILGRWASSRLGSEPMRTVWTTWSGYGGPPALSVRFAATLEVGG